MKSINFTMYEGDYNRFRDLHPEPGAAFKFWKEVWCKYVTEPMGGTKDKFPVVRRVKDREFNVQFTSRKIVKK